MTRPRIEPRSSGPWVNTLLRTTKKRTCRIVDFAVPADHRVKSREGAKDDKYLDFVKELKKSDGDINCNWCSRYGHQRIGKGTGGLGNKRTSGDHPNYSFIKISQNTEKSPGDLRRLVVTQAPVKNHQLMLL